MSNIRSDELIKQLMSLGYTEDELSYILGVSQCSISYWLNRKRIPSVNNLLKICTLLGKPLREYLETDEEVRERRKEIDDKR